MFKIFNPITATHTEAATIEDARAVRNNFVAQWVVHCSPRPVDPGQYLYVDGWMDDFYVAYVFMCEKRGLIPVPLASITDPYALGLAQNHAIYNTTTHTRWSRTFRYITEDGALWLIKVINGEATDWYKEHGDVNGTQYAWVMFDVLTGEPFDVYNSTQPNVLVKTNLKNQNATAVTTTFASFDGLPKSYKDALALWPYRDRIFAWSDRSYGQIVEYTEDPLRDPAQWPQEMIEKNAALRAQAEREAEARGRQLATVVEVKNDEFGNQTWQAVELDERAA